MGQRKRRANQERAKRQKATIRHPRRMSLIEKKIEPTTNRTTKTKRQRKKKTLRKKGILRKKEKMRMRKNRRGGANQIVFYLIFVHYHLTDIIYSSPYRFR